MTSKTEVSTHEVGNIVLLSKKVAGSSMRVWYIKCPDCGGDHTFRKTGAAMWHTSCFISKTGYIMTPHEFYIEKSFDLSAIMKE